MPSGIPVGYEFGPFYLDRQGRTLRSGGEVVPLPRKAVVALLLLVENNGTVVSREQILNRVWPDRSVEDGNISMLVWSLRRLFARCSYLDPIETISRRGYLFRPEVRPRLRESVAMATADKSPSLTPQGARSASAASHQTPMPACLPDGRCSDRADLSLKLDEALAGKGSLTLIGGEAGIGKTRLGNEVLEEARQRGFTTLIGHSYRNDETPGPLMQSPGEASLNTTPFVEILEACASLVPRAAFLAALGDSAAELARLMPALRRMFPDIPPGVTLPAHQQQRYLFNAYRSFMDRVCQVSPIVVLLEDLHWAGESSLLLLRHLALGLEFAPQLRLRVAILANYRDNEPQANPHLDVALEHLARNSAVSRMVLRSPTPSDLYNLFSAIDDYRPAPGLGPLSIGEVLLPDEEGRIFTSDPYSKRNEDFVSAKNPRPNRA